MATKSTVHLLADAVLIAATPESERTPADKELLTIAAPLAERVQRHDHTEAQIQLDATQTALVLTEDEWQALYTVARFFDANCDDGDGCTPAHEVAERLLDLDEAERQDGTDM